MILLGALAVTFAVTTLSSADTLPLRGALFILDPGHGIVSPRGRPLDSGAVGRSGTREERVALAVGEDLASLLRAAGARVVLTRSYARPWRVARVARLDNRARAEMANRLHATAFVAIHFDASSNRKLHGTSVFWLRENSRAMANSMRTHLRALALGSAQFRRRKLAVTDQARVPAVLVELGFVSNTEQERRIATPAFPQRAARALYGALISLYGHA